MKDSIDHTVDSFNAAPNHSPENSRFETGKRLLFFSMFILGAAAIGVWTISIAKPSVEGDLPHFYSGKVYSEVIGVFFLFCILYGSLLITLYFRTNQRMDQKRPQKSLFSHGLICAAGSLSSGLLLALFIVNDKFISKGCFKTYFSPSIAISLGFWLFLSISLSTIFIWLISTDFRSLDNEFFYITIIVSTIFILFIQAKSPNELYYDSFQYHDLGEKITGTGQLDFSSFPQSFRGYFFPFLLSIFAKLLLFLPDKIHAYSFLLSGMYCFATALFLTKFSRDLSNRRDVSFRVFTLTGILVFSAFFFTDCFIYSLSDIAALSLILIVCSYLHDVLHNSINKINAWPIYREVFLSGVLLYAAYNTRTIYIVTTGLIILFFVVKQFRYKTKSVLLYTILFSGIFFAGVPQLVINHTYQGVTSIAVTTKIDENDSLYMSQMVTGLQFLMRETYVGDDTSIPPAVLYSDPQGEALSQRFGKITTVWDYAALFFTHPISMTGLLVKHFIAMLFPYTTDFVYIQSYDRISTWKRFIFFTLYFLTAIDLKRRLQIGFKLHDLFSEQFCFPFFIFLCSIAAIPSVIEPRFGLPLFFIVLYYFFTRIDYRSLFKMIRKNWLSYALAYIVILCVLCSLWMSVTALNPIGMILID